MKTRTTVVLIFVFWLLALGPIWLGWIKWRW